MSIPEEKDKARIKRQRNFVSKNNKNKPKRHRPKTLYSRSEGKRVHLSDS